jgi:hypothetical protein
MSAGGCDNNYPGRNAHIKVQSDVVGGVVVSSIEETVALSSLFYLSMFAAPESSLNLVNICNSVKYEQHQGFSTAFRT